MFGKDKIFDKIMVGGDMKRVLSLMVSKYAITNYDWMNFQITEENPLTYHHICKKEFGGKKDLRNGALLTEKAQMYLHLIEKYNKRIYNQINQTLKEINNQGYPPTAKQIAKIDLYMRDFEQRYGDILGQKRRKPKFNATLERQRLQHGEGYVKKKSLRKKNRRTVEKNVKM